MKANHTLTDALTCTLATSIYLRASHWNVEGESFFPLHEFYGEIYEELDEEADTLAERIVALGTYAIPDVELVSDRLVTMPKADGNPKAVLDILEINRKNLEKACDGADKVTENMILPWLEARDKAIWKLKAHCADED